MTWETISALQTAFERAGSSLTAFAASLGLSPGLVSDVLHGRHGHVSLAAENRVRHALGLQPLGTYQVPPCRTCGQVHVAPDCQGKPVAAVVVLAPGERVRGPRPRPAWLDAAVRNLRELEEKARARREKGVNS